MWRISLLSILALLAAACTVEVEDDPEASPSPTAVGTAAPELASCEQAEIGYTVSYPQDWETNPGDVAPTCSYFDPEPIELEEGTEPDVAIAFRSEEVAFATAADPESFGRIRSLDRATIDGRQAVAVVHETTGDGLLPEGTLAYVWLIDLDDGTFIATTYDTPERDIDASMDVLDLMIDSLDVTAPAPDEEDQADADPPRTVIARFEGGGLPFVVFAETDGDELCFIARAGNDEERTCGWDPSPPDGMSLRGLPVPGAADAVAGITEESIERVLVGHDEAATFGSRPTALPDAQARAWVAPFAQPDVRHAIGYRDRRMAVALDGAGESTTVFADVNTDPQRTDRSDDFRLLEDVETGLHAGYDRVAFRFDDDVPGFEASYEERPIRAAGSGNEVEVAGDAVIVLRMQQASGRERTGEGEETYTGPQRIDAAGTYAMLEVVRTGDFEGVLTWAIGVSEELPFRVDAIGDVLVVDVRHSEV